MSHADDTTLPCAHCGGDTQTGHQRLCKTFQPLIDAAERDLHPDDEERIEAALEELSPKQDELDQPRPQRRSHMRTIEREALPFRIPIVVQSPSARRALLPFTVTFYTKQIQPLALPHFPYSITGTVLGHAKMTAFVEAHSSVDIDFMLRDYFDVAEVDLILPGHAGIHDAHLHGTVLPPAPASIWKRIKAYFFGIE